MSWEDTEKYEALAKGLEENRLETNILCAKCQHGHLMRRRKHLAFDVYCSNLRRFVPSDLAECSRYANHKRMTMYEMEQVALVIDKREPGGQYA